jgi:CRISPR-associated protein Cmr4
MYFLHALTPLHVGAGRGLGYIDLPIVREKVMNFPYVPGSSVKGVIAESFGASEKERKNNQELKVAFGVSNNEKNDSGEKSSNSGSLVFTDARLLCLPVRSLYGTFAWATSATILQRFQRDGESIGNKKLNYDIPTINKDSDALVTKESKVVKDDKIYLEDLDITARTDALADHWSGYFAEKLFSEDKERDSFKNRFIILSDNVFNFLCETGTEVSPHIRINDESKTTSDHALWYEEALPTETILSGVVWCDKIYGDANQNQTDLLDTYTKPKNNILQFGGKATTGKGIVRFIAENEKGGN